LGGLHALVEPEPEQRSCIKEASPAPLNCRKNGTVPHIHVSRSGSSWRVFGRAPTPSLGEAGGDLREALPNGAEVDMNHRFQI
jgi:hypothetical protein